MPRRDPIAYDADAGLLMIPGDPRVDHTPSFAVFDDSAPALRAFLLSRLRARDVVPAPPGAGCDAVIPVRLHLVPRPDNDYDERAVSVAAPPGDGGSVLDRHMGYLYSSALHITSQSIRDLTDGTGTPVGCHGWITLHDLENDARHWGDEEVDEAEYGDGWKPDRHTQLTWAEQTAFGYAVGGVRVVLPERGTVRALVDAYLDAYEPEPDAAAEPGPGTAAEPGPDAAAEPGPRAEQAGLVERSLRRALAERLAVRLRTGLAHRAAGGAWGRETDRDRARRRRDAEALPLVAAWETYRATPHGLTGLRAVTRSVFGRTRTLVLDGAGVEVGRYHEPYGPLTLTDERARPAALAALRAHGVDADAPADLAALDGFPDALVVVGSGGRWSIRLARAGVPVEALAEAGWFDPDSGTLTVYAEPFAGPLTVLLRRHGVRPLLVTRGAPDEATDRHNLRAVFVKEEVSPFCRSSRVSVASQRLLPEPYRRWLNARPGTGTEDRAYQVVDDAAESPYYRRALESLFGAPVDLARRAPCRLCGRSAQSARPGLFYCHSCCALAQNGVLRDTGVDGDWTEAVVFAVRRLAETEFSGPPSLAQLQRVTVPYTAPARVDEAMLLRFLAPRPASALSAARPRRPARTWTEWLAHAGLLADGVRASLGTASTATDGHLCRSLFERHVDDFLHHWGVAHEPEPAYPRHPELNTTGLRADWRLADGTYVEALGLMAREAYAAKVARKRELARLHGVRLVTVTAEDLERLPEVFADWLPASPDRLPV